jgi:hypothetical protein
VEKQDILAKLRENEAALKARGVVHAALFGSRARGKARPGSDIVILIDIDPDTPVGGGNMLAANPTLPRCRARGRSTPQKLNHRSRSFLRVFSFASSETATPTT